MPVIETPSDPRDDRVRAIGAVRLPLQNMAFTIDRHLHDNGARIDPETRRLLAGLRDSLGEVADSARRIAGEG